MQPPASPTSFKGEASLLQGVDGRKDGAGDLVGAAQQPVGEGQHLASGVAAQCCKHHGEAYEEEHCVAGDTQGGRIPPGEVEGEGQRDAEREAQRADAAERLRVAASAPPVPGQHESGEADEAERPGSRRVCGGGKARRELGVDHAAGKPEPEYHAGCGADGPDVPTVPLLPLLPEEFDDGDESDASYRPGGVHYIHLKASTTLCEGE